MALKSDAVKTDLGEYLNKARLNGITTLCIAILSEREFAISPMEEGGTTLKFAFDSNTVHCISEERTGD